MLNLVVVYRDKEHQRRNASQASVGYSEKRQLAEGAKRCPRRVASTPRQGDALNSVIQLDLPRPTSRRTSRRANLREAHLEGADLREVHLEGANLSNAHLERADFRHAHLEGANLRGAVGLAAVQLAEASGDADTKLHAGLDRPAHWPAPDEPDKTA